MTGDGGPRGYGENKRMDPEEQKRSELTEGDGGSFSHGAHVVNQDLDDDYDDGGAGRDDYDD